MTAVMLVEPAQQRRVKLPLPEKLQAVGKARL